MVEHNPFTVDDLCYSANDFRLMQGGLICGEGVADYSHLWVGETSPPSGDVQVHQGHGFIQNDNDPPPLFISTSVYHAYNDGAVTLTVPLNSSGVTRTDVVWAQVCDSEYAAVTSGFTLVYDDNNPTATPPADGCTYYLLATLAVPNGGGFGGTDIAGAPAWYGETDGMITDNRRAFTLCGDDGGWVQATATLDFPSVGAGLAELLTMTVAGATVGDPVAFSSSVYAFSSQLMMAAYVSATDTVTCRVFNPTVGALNPPSGNWTVAVKIR